MGQLKTPWSKVTYTGRIGFGILLVFIVLTLLGVAWLVFLGFVLYWNITDIQHVGVNFWNVFWIVLAGLGILGTFRSNN